MTLLGRRLLAAMIVMPLAVMLAGCSRKTKVVYVPAPPPPPPITAPKQTPSPDPGRPSQHPAIAAAGDSADIDFVATHTPISSEEGLASWYGPPYHNRKAANGQVFDQNAMTAAHRTLPLNSLIKVTNLQTGQSVVVRVTDRGPFVQGRVLDLSMASAKAAGVWRPGIAKVRIDVYQAPSAIAEGGRWCVQVGAFKNEDEAIKLARSPSPQVSHRQRNRIYRSDGTLGAHSSASRRQKEGV